MIMIASIFLSGMVFGSASKPTFKEAFSAARAKQGSGGKFTWNGNEYNTNLKPSASTNSGAQKIQNLENNVNRNLNQNGVGSFAQTLFGGNSGSGNNNASGNGFNTFLNNQNMFGGDDQHNFGNLGQNANFGNFGSFGCDSSDSDSGKQSKFGKFKTFAGNYLGKIVDLGVDGINIYDDCGTFNERAKVGAPIDPNFGKDNVESFKNSIRNFKNPTTGSKYFNKEVGDEIKKEFTDSKQKLKNFNFKEHVKECLNPSQSKFNKKKPSKSKSNKSKNQDSDDDDFESFGTSNFGSNKPFGSKFGGSSKFSKFQNKFNKKSGGSKFGKKKMFNMDFSKSSDSDSDF